MRRFATAGELACDCTARVGESRTRDRRRGAKHDERVAPRATGGLDSFGAGSGAPRVSWSGKKTTPARVVMGELYRYRGRASGCGDVEDEKQLRTVRGP